MAAPSLSSSSSSSPAPPSKTKNSGKDGLVSWAVRAWLVEQGFEPGDLRSEKKAGFCCMLTPMEWANRKGEMKVHKWLCDNGGLVPGEEQAVRAWLVQQGFEPGDLRNEKEIDYYIMTPIARACYKGELNVCKWLYNHGAAEDISRADNYGQTPMHGACWNGHLSVCEWLYKVGADEDISRANDHGNTPMSSACAFHHPSVCEWLVLNGALNRPTSSPTAAAEEEDEDDNDQAGHIDPAILQRDTTKLYSWSTDRRPALLDWAKRVVNTHHTFLHVVLRGSVILPACQRHGPPEGRCLLPRLYRSDHVIMRRVGLFLGVEAGRQLRNAREFAEACRAALEDDDDCDY